MSYSDVSLRLCYELFKSLFANADELIRHLILNNFRSVADGLRKGDALEDVSWAATELLAKRGALQAFLVALAGPDGFTLRRADIERVLEALLAESKQSQASKLVAREPLAFISFRRTDSSGASRWLANTIARTFGAQSVFIDTEWVRDSDDWRERLSAALAAATLLIPVIGPHWLSPEPDEKFHRRLIDNEDDWVRNEILHALESKQRILPVLISGTPMPPADALPGSIRGLCKLRPFELRDEWWEGDLGTLLAEMERLGFRRKSTGVIRYPTPMVNVRELAAAELQKELERLPGWKSAVSDLPDNPGRQRSEIVRSYEFVSFEVAMEFMAIAARKISEIDHHPRWENIWRTVTVALSTWDIGHKPSKLDLSLAQYLDELYLETNGVPKSGGRQDV